MQKKYLTATYYFDIESPEIQELIADYTLVPESEKIARLYLKVRDGWRYSPFNIGLTAKHFKASSIFRKNEAHCIDKSILYIAGLRALGIPARLRLAKVSNHIAIERLEKKLGTSEIAPHGLVEVYSQGKWVKCAPIFNKELCTLYNVQPLDFDGSENSILQEYNSNHQKFMEYIEDYGSFEDVPLDFIKETFKNMYPSLYDAFKNESEITI